MAVIGQQSANEHNKMRTAPQSQAANNIERIAH
jgi:hypothetical protein